jgi:hypothetical protein
MQKSSHVFSRGPFFSMWSISTVFSIVSYVCYVSSICCANLELGLLVFITWMCSLKSIRKFLPVCSTYFNGRLGRAVAQAVSRWLPTAAARARVRAACGVFGGQSGIGAGFLRVLRFTLPIIPPISQSS